MLNYKILCIGGAGENIVNALLINRFDQDKLFFLNTDSQSIDRNPIRNKFLIGQNAILGNAIVPNPKVGMEVFQEDKTLFDTLTKENCIYIIAGGFGGEIFTGIIGQLSEFLTTKKKKFIIVGTLPFAFEGKKRNAASIDGVREINHYTDKLILLKNDDLRKLFGNLTLGEAFRKSDNAIVEVIKEILFEIDSSEIINKKSLPLNANLEDLILRIKLFIKESEYIISTSSSKIIVANTNKELLKALTIDPNLVHKISPRKFEELIEYIYMLSGYKTELTKATRDNGADILVWTPPPVMGDNFLTVIQAKRYAKQKKVGSSEIRELIGTKMIFKADKAQIITTSDFSSPAIKTAKSNKIDLLKFYELNDTIIKLIK